MENKIRPATETGQAKNQNESSQDAQSSQSLPMRQMNLQQNQVSRNRLENPNSLSYSNTQAEPNQITESQDVLNRMSRKNLPASPASKPLTLKVVTQNSDLNEASSPEPNSAISNQIFKINLNRIAIQQSDSEEEIKEGQPVLAPQPLLPRTKNEFRFPPKCPLPTVAFILLRKFQAFGKEDVYAMGEGWNIISQSKKIKQKIAERLQVNPRAELILENPQIKPDDPINIIRNIVFAREHNHIDMETLTMYQIDAYMHENYLNLKELIRKREILENVGQGESPTSLAAKQLRRQQNACVTGVNVYRLKDMEDRTLLFESRFECGNLYLAQKVSDNEYNCFMQNDINTQGHTQWFYFRVMNTRAGQTVKFNIVNYSKPDSLFNYGMKISIYSEKKTESTGIGWFKDGKDISYYSNGVRRDPNMFSKNYFSLSFSYTFEYDLDVVFFAYSTPYSFTDLRNDLDAIESNEERGENISRKLLCKTLAGEDCEIITITSKGDVEAQAQRKCVVVTGRVHPGETVGSWMMRGVLYFLTDPNNIEAKLLRDNFVFKIVPMLNPDGVINGNYRTSLAGCDLNRRWKTPSKTLHPEIYAVKKLVKQVHQQRQCLLFCDLHGHSRKNNVFMYGCHNKNDPAQTRLFPFILSKLNPFFSFENSKFGIQKSKEATARISLYKELQNCPNVFTMESSFAGLDVSEFAGKHLSTEMMESLGQDLVRTILIYTQLYVPEDLRNQFNMKQKAPGDGKTFAEDPVNFSQLIMSELQFDKNFNKAADGDSSSGSDSAPSDDNLEANELIKNLPDVDKNLKKKIKQENDKKEREAREAKEAAEQARKIAAQQKLQKKPEPPKRITSPQKKQEVIKPPAPKPEPVVEPVKPEVPAKKPKVETKDAITQTDRSDYALIKAKQQREALVKKQLEETQQKLIKQNEQSKFQNQRVVFQTQKGTQLINKPQHVSNTKQMLMSSGLQQLVSQKQITPAVVSSSNDFLKTNGFQQLQKSPRKNQSIEQSQVKQPNLFEQPKMTNKQPVVVQRTQGQVQAAQNMQISMNINFQLTQPPRTDGRNQQKTESNDRNKDRFAMRQGSIQKKDHESGRQTPSQMIQMNQSIASIQLNINQQVTGSAQKHKKTSSELMQGGLTQINFTPKKPIVIDTQKINREKEESVLTNKQQSNSRLSKDAQQRNQNIKSVENRYVRRSSQL